MFFGTSDSQVSQFYYSIKYACISILISFCSFQNYHLAISEAHSEAQSCNSGRLFIFLSHFCVR